MLPAYVCVCLAHSQINEQSNEKKMKNENEWNMFNGLRHDSFNREIDG